MRCRAKTDAPDLFVGSLVPSVGGGFDGCDPAALHGADAQLLRASRNERVGAVAKWSRLSDQQCFK